MKVALFFCLVVVGHSAPWPARFNSLGRGPPFAEQDVGTKTDVLTSDSGRVENVGLTVEGEVERAQPAARFGSLFGRGAQTPPFGALLSDTTSVHQGQSQPQDFARTDLQLNDQQRQLQPQLVARSDLSLNTQPEQYQPELVGRTDLPLSNNQRRQPPPSGQTTFGYGNANQKGEESNIRTRIEGSTHNRKVPHFKVVLLRKKDDEEEEDSRGDDKESHETGRENIGKQIASSRTGERLVYTVESEQANGHFNEYMLNSEKSVYDSVQSFDDKKPEYFLGTQDRYQNQFIEKLANQGKIPVSGAGKTAAIKQPYELNHEEHFVITNEDSHSVNSARADVLNRRAPFQSNVRKAAERSISSVNEQTFVEAQFQPINDEAIEKSSDVSPNDPNFTVAAALQPASGMDVAAATTEPLVGHSNVAAAEEPPVGQNYVAAAVEPAVGQSNVAAALEPTVGQIYVAAAVEPSVGQSYVAAAVEPAVGQSNVAAAPELAVGQIYVAAAVEPPVGQSYVAAAVEPPVGLSYVAAAVEPPVGQSYVAAAVEPTVGQSYVAAAVEPTVGQGQSNVGTHSAASVESPVGQTHSAAAVEAPVRQTHSAAALESPVGQIHSAAAVEAPVGQIHSAAVESLVGQIHSAAALESPGQIHSAAAVEAPVGQIYSAAAVEPSLGAATQPHVDTTGEVQSSFNIAAVAEQWPVDETEKVVAEGFLQSRYTNLDLSAVDFNDFKQRSSGHKEYITVKDNDFSGETDIYRLVGVAPSQAVRGGAATTYSAKIGPSVPIYAELDDADSYWIRSLAAGSRSRSGGATPYSSGRPIKVRAETAVSGDTFAVILDD